MKLCIPVNSPNGIESLLEPHLPRAEHLLFFDTETRLCEEISLREAPAGSAENIEIHAVLCGSINRVTLRTLIEQGIAVYGTEAQTAAQAIAQYESGELEAAVVAAAGHGHAGGCGCSGHGEAGGCGGHGHEHGKEGGCGHGEGGGCGGHGDGQAHQGGGCCGSRASAGDAVADRARGDVLKIAVTSQNKKDSD